MRKQAQERKNLKSLVTISIEIETSDSELEKRLILLEEDFSIETLEYLMKFADTSKVKVKTKKKGD